MTISAKEFEEGLAKREVQKITHHTQAVDLAEDDRAKIAALGDRMNTLEDTLQDVAALALQVSEEPVKRAKSLTELRQTVAESLDDIIATVTAELKR